MRPGRRAVLAYHRIADVDVDPFALAVSPADFGDHLDILRSRSHLVDLDEMLQRETSDTSILVSLTFDDGYVDNLATAAPMLAIAQAPATYFVCTDPLGDLRGYWWDRLASAIAASGDPRGALDLAARDTALTHATAARSAAAGAATPTDATQATLAIAERLQPLAPDDRDRSLAELEARLPVGPGRSRAPCPILDPAGLRKLASRPGAQLGAHTHRHPMLSGLGAAAQLSEIARSADVIEELTGTRPRYLAYPYGDVDDYDRRSCRAAERAGMRAAFTNHAGRFDPRRRPYRMPRAYVPPLDADGFRRWLDWVLVR